LDFRTHFDIDSINGNWDVTGEDCSYFESKSSNKLLVTLGESWTWGGSLQNYLSTEERLQSIWGKHLSNHIGSDWLNVARPGASNLWIVFQLQELVRFIDNYGPLPYEKIQVVLCCTEWGREYDENWDWFTDFNLKLQEPIKQNAALVEYAQFWLDKINADLLVTHNFCDPEFWKHDLPQLNKNWIQVTCEKLNQEYVYQIPTMAHYSHLKNTGMDLSKIIEYQDCSLNLANFLNESKYNHHNAHKHPTVESHKFWADFIYKEHFSV